MRSATNRHPSAISASVTVTTCSTSSHKRGNVFWPTWRKMKKMLDPNARNISLINAFLILRKLGSGWEWRRSSTFRKYSLKISFDSTHFSTKFVFTCWVLIPSAMVSKNCGGFSHLKFPLLLLLTQLVHLNATHATQLNSMLVMQVMQFTKVFVKETLATCVLRYFSSKKKLFAHSLSLLCRQRSSSFPVGSTATTLQYAMHIIMHVQKSRFSFCSQKDTRSTEATTTSPLPPTPTKKKHRQNRPWLFRLPEQGIDWAWVP